MSNINVEQVWANGENTITIETPEGQPNIVITMWKNWDEYAGQLRSIDVTLEKRRDGMRPIVYHGGNTKFDNANVIAVQIPTASDWALR